MAERKVSNKEILILNKINDLYKNIPINVYVNENDEDAEEFKNIIYFKDGLILFNGHDGLAPMIMGIIPKNDNKYDFLRDKTFKIDCKRFFDYLKNGKDAETVNYGKDFNFRVSKASNEFHCTLTKDDEDDIEYIIKRIFEFKKITENKSYQIFDFKEDLVDKFKGNGLYHLYFNKNGYVTDSYDEKEYLFKMDIYSKYLVKLDSKSIVKVKVFSDNTCSRYLDFIIETNDIKSHQYMKMVVPLISKDEETEN